MGCGDGVEGDFFMVKIDEGRLFFVVFCIDGVDLDDIILLCIVLGELLIFVCLFEEGIFVFFEMFMLMLLFVVWMSFVIGKCFEEYGILYFIFFDLLFVKMLVLVFFLYIGFNFKIFLCFE